MYLNDRRPRNGSMSGFGDPSTAYSAATDCTLIPAGDPYRLPPNQCTTAGQLYNFDASGNVVAVDKGVVFGLSGTELMVIGCAAAAFILFGGKKARR